jgi:hypothetical protein
VSERALDTEEGRAVALEIVAMLESELVRFCHRVAHDHLIALDRARASMVLLGTLVGSGVPWTARADSSPQHIHDAFAELAARNPVDWPPASQIRAEVATFLDACSEIAIVDVAVTSPADKLRAAGADPDMWWWAGDHDTLYRSWVAAGEHAGRVVQVALTMGVPADRVARALANVFAQAAQKAKTRRAEQRDDLVALLGKLAADGAAALAQERALVASTTKLAFEMAAAQQAWWTGGKRGTQDPLAEVAVLSFQLVELFGAVSRAPDLERFADLANRADRAFAARGMRLAALLRHDLDPDIPR